MQRSIAGRGARIEGTRDELVRDSRDAGDRTRGAELERERPWSGLEELRGSLRLYLLRQCSDENEVDDVIQETYLRVARYRGRLGEGAKLRPWTMRIARNVLADRGRRARRLQPATCVETEVQSIAEDEEPEQPSVRIGRFDVPHEQALGLLRRALRTLREGDRRLLRSFYGEGRSCRRLALEADLLPDQVKVRLFRARRRLGRAMRHRLALESGPGPLDSALVSS